jgi:hypothetical protein
MLPSGLNRVTWTSGSPLRPVNTVVVATKPPLRRNVTAPLCEAVVMAAARLGTNLSASTTSSTRMSPAGIPLFYGADDVETALAEVSHSDPREFFTVGKFVTTQPMTVIDLTRVDVPSRFDQKLGAYQGDVRFLDALIEELHTREPRMKAMIDASAQRVHRSDRHPHHRCDVARP